MAKRDGFWKRTFGSKPKVPGRWGPHASVLSGVSWADRSLIPPSHSGSPLTPPDLCTACVCATTSIHPSVSGTGGDRVHTLSFSEFDNEQEDAW